MDYELKGVRPRGRPKKAWSEVIAEDCQTQKYAMKMTWTAGNGES